MKESLLRDTIQRGGCLTFVPWKWENVSFLFFSFSLLLIEMDMCVCVFLEFFWWLVCIVGSVVFWGVARRNFSGGSSPGNENEDAEHMEGHPYLLFPQL